MSGPGAGLGWAACHSAFWCLLCLLWNALVCRRGGVPADLPASLPIHSPYRRPLRPPAITAVTAPQPTTATIPNRSVTGLAAVLLSLCALLFEGASLAAGGKHGVVGWVASGRYLPKVLWLGVVPGIVGHTGVRGGAGVGLHVACTSCVDELHWVWACR